MTKNESIMLTEGRKCMSRIEEFVSKVDEFYRGAFQSDIDEFSMVLDDVDNEDKKIIRLNKLRQEMEINRDRVAEETYMNFDLGLDAIGGAFKDHHGWEIQDNGTYRTRKFYYETEDTKEFESETATFVIKFEEDSSKIKDRHINWE